MSLASTLPRHMFTGADVMRMVEAGILNKNEKVELIEGDLIQMTPQGPPHAGLSTRLNRLLSAAYGPAACVRVGCPLECGERNLPEPDLAVVNVSEDELMLRHPGGREALLAVEIANSSHLIDRIKIAVYARAGVAVYWLIDLPARRIEVHERPQAEGSYAVVTILKAGDSISPPGTSALWTLDSLLPP